MPPAFNKVHHFQKSLSAEALWLPRTPELFPQCELKDVSQDARYQPLGVDFLVKRDSGPSGGLEMKFDSYSSGNLALEWVSQDRPSSPGAPSVKAGWMATCQAGWLAYAFVSTGDLLLMEMATLRSWLAQNYARFSSTSVANRSYFSYCSLAPIDEVLRGLPSDKCHWFDMRTRLQAPSFEADLLASPALRTKEASEDTVAQALLQGGLRSSPLAMTSLETSKLWQHLWAKNRLYRRHAAPEGRRTLVLRPLVLESGAESCAQGSSETLQEKGSHALEAAMA